MPSPDETNKGIQNLLCMNVYDIRYVFVYVCKHVCVSVHLLPCHIHLPVCLWTMDPHSRAPKKNTSHGNEVLLQDATHLTQRPCYQQGSPCQDPAGNQTTRRPPDHRKETQTAVVWSCFPFIRSGQNSLARHSERGIREEDKAGRRRGGKTTSGNRQALSSPSPIGQWRIEKNGGNWLWNHLWCPNNPCG